MHVACYIEHVESIIIMHYIQTGAEQIRCSEEEMLPPWLITLGWRADAAAQRPATPVDASTAAHGHADSTATEQPPPGSAKPSDDAHQLPGYADPLSATAARDLVSECAQAHWAHLFICQMFI